ncbi:MAG: thiamine phosphate synthase [Rickettsiales bacterium]|nr:thiamine phosphate synthase [Rickettsiales bacterium]
MDQKILFEINKFIQKNRKKNLVKNLPVSIFFTDRKKNFTLDKTIKSLPKESAIVIREYDLNKKDREDFIKKVLALNQDKRLKILIGKDIALAKKVKADGVHFSDFDKLPLQFLQKQKFHKNFIFSFSCHNFKTILKAQKIKADLIIISPVFPTTSHLNTEALGIKNLAKISFKNKSHFYSASRFYALGGINSLNLSAVRKLNLSGFAAISLFLKTL